MSHLTLTSPALAAYLEQKRLYGNMHLYNKADRLAAKFRINELYGKFLPNKLYRFNNQRGLTGSQLAAVANKARQRHKGPLVRFGRKYER